MTLIYICVIISNQQNDQLSDPEILSQLIFLQVENIYSSFSLLMPASNIEFVIYDATIGFMCLY